MEPRQPQDSSSSPGDGLPGARDVPTRTPWRRASRWGMNLLLVVVGLGRHPTPCANTRAHMNSEFLDYRRGASMVAQCWS
jgi:hypothetical protein